jgi:hypothetical protein
MLDRVNFYIHFSFLYEYQLYTVYSSKMEHGDRGNQTRTYTLLVIGHAQISNKKIVAKKSFILSFLLVLVNWYWKKETVTTGNIYIYILP